MNQLRLPPSLRSLALTKFARYNREESNPWDAPHNKAVYAGLRALHLGSFRLPDYLPYAEFGNLVYLGLNRLVETRWLENIEMPNLRVLIVHEPIIPSRIEMLPEKFPNLQHLSIRVQMWDLVTQGNVLAPLAKLKHLKSLCVKPTYYPCYYMVGYEAKRWTPADWGWLEEIAKRGQLEHVDIADDRFHTGCLPRELACRIIRQCRVSLDIASACKLLIINYLN